MGGRRCHWPGGFHHSAANKAANLTWDTATLDTYLPAPRAVVPGTIMAHAGRKDDTWRPDTEHHPTIWNRSSDKDAR